MPSPKFTIMVLTQPTRSMWIERLFRYLAPQLAEYSHDIELLVQMCDYSISVGDNRQQLREAAKGKYSVYIDDDDLVADDYVERVLQAIEQDIDYVGYYLERYDDGKLTGRFRHSLTEGNISHVNPIKTELALTQTMSGGFGEDRRWWNPLRESGIVQTEHFIDETMYFYYYRSAKTDGVPKIAGEQHEG